MRPGDPGHLRARCMEELGTAEPGTRLGGGRGGTVRGWMPSGGGGTSQWVNREEQNEAELSWAPRQQSLPGTGTVGLFLWLGQRSHLGCVRT